MVDLRPYEKLHAIQLLKGVIRKWWGVELALADAKGYTLAHGEGKIIPPQNEFCRLALFSKEGFRRCNESVTMTRDQLRAGPAGGASGKRLAVVHQCHLGFDVVAAPVIIDGDLAGFLYTGVVEHKPSIARGEPAPTRMMVWLA